MRPGTGEGKHEEHSLGILYQEYKLRKLSKVKKKKTQQEMRQLLLPIGVSSIMSSQKWLGERTMAVTDETLPGG